MKKTLFFIALVVVLAGAGFAYLQYNMPHRDTSAEEPAYVLEAEALFAEYSADEAAANAKFVDKLLLVKGAIAGISEAEDSTVSIMLQTADPMSGVSIQLLPEEAAKSSSLQTDDQIWLKGICSGKLMDVVLVRGVLVEQ